MSYQMGYTQALYYKSSIPGSHAAYRKTLAYCESICALLTLSAENVSQTICQLHEVLLIRGDKVFVADSLGQLIDMIHPNEDFQIHLQYEIGERGAIIAGAADPVHEQFMELSNRLEEMLHSLYETTSEALSCYEIGTDEASPNEAKIFSSNERDTVQLLITGNEVKPATLWRFRDLTIKLSESVISLPETLKQAIRQFISNWNDQGKEERELMPGDSLDISTQPCTHEEIKSIIKEYMALRNTAEQYDRAISIVGIAVNLFGALKIEDDNLFSWFFPDCDILYN